MRYTNITRREFENFLDQWPWTEADVPWGERVYDIPLPADDLSVRVMSTIQRTGGTTCEIAELTPGDEDVTVQATVVELGDRRGYDDGRLQKIVLRDQTGNIQCVFWDDDVSFLTDVSVGDQITVRGKVDEWRGGSEMQVWEPNPDLGDARDVGQDAIRTVVWHHEFERPIGGRRKTLRIGPSDSNPEGWRGNLRPKIEWVRQNWRVYDAAQMTCPDCGSEMTGAKSEYGEFMSCTECDHTEDLADAMCPECEGPMTELDGQYGEFLLCQDCEHTMDA